MVPFLVFLVLSTLVSFTSTLPDGAPETVCDTLMPHHGGGIEPMRSTSPYSIVPGVHAIAQGQTLTVEIDPVPPELKFGGFMIHARSTSPPFRVVSTTFIKKRTKKQKSISSSI